MKTVKALTATLLIGGLMTLVSAPAARADHDRSKCQQRIEKAEARLDDAIRHHGEHSRQAEDRRHDLRAERERCWNEQHGWWDGHAHQWHTDRDWDHDDHH
jgi:hypothetical protein